MVTRRNGSQVPFSLGANSRPSAGFGLSENADDRSGVIVAQALTEPRADDATTGAGLVEQVDGDIESVTADTAYDTIAFYATAQARGATVVVPPARTASLSRRGPRSTDRGLPRVQRLESADRTRSARILQHRSLRCS